MTEPLIGVASSLGLSRASYATVAMIAERVADGEADIALELLAELEVDVAAVRRHLVMDCRARGFSWGEIGSMLGCSGAAAHKKYGAWDTAVTAGGHNLTRSRGFEKGGSS